MLLERLAVGPSRKWVSRPATMNGLRREIAGVPAGGGNGAAHGAAGLLGLAAAPTFGIMALLTGVHRGDPPDILCSAGQNWPPLSGMTLMYLLMSVFHLVPWLKLISGRRNGNHRP